MVSNFSLLTNKKTDPCDRFFCLVRKLSASERRPHTAAAMQKRGTRLSRYIALHGALPFPLYPQAEQSPKSTLRVATDSFPHQKMTVILIQNCSHFFIHYGVMAYHHRTKCGGYHQKERFISLFFAYHHAFSVY